MPAACRRLCITGSPAGHATSGRQAQLCQAIKAPCSPLGKQVPELRSPRPRMPAHLLVPAKMQREHAAVGAVLAAHLHPSQVVVPGICPAVGDREGVRVEREEVGGRDADQPAVAPAPGELGRKEAVLLRRRRRRGAPWPAALGLLLS